MPTKKISKKEMRELDEAWKKHVKERDNWTCQVCKKNLKDSPRNCHAHHILPKQIKGMRWDINNGIVLCYQHHKVGKFSAHMNAIWFAFWLKTNKNQQFKYTINKLIHINEDERYSINTAK